MGSFRTSRRSSPRSGRPRRPSNGHESSVSANRALRISVPSGIFLLWVCDLEKESAMKLPRERLSVVVVALLSVTACSPESEPPRTVSWFEQHPEERKALLAKCQDDPGRLAETPNCVNASQAEGQASIGSVREKPHLKLPLLL